MDNHYAQSDALRPHGLPGAQAPRRDAGWRGRAHRCASDGAAGGRAGHGVAKAGADYISFHPDASTHVHRSIQNIKAHGARAGLTFNPATPLDVLDWVIEDIDLILLMSVNPGFGGQSHRQHAAQGRGGAPTHRPSGRDIRLEVDGGIKAANIRRVADAGADTFVAGSAIFSQPDYRGVVDAMRAALA